MLLVPSPEPVENCQRENGVFKVVSIRAKLRDGSLRSSGPSGSRLRSRQSFFCPTEEAIPSACGVDGLFYACQLRAKVQYDACHIHECSCSIRCRYCTVSVSVQVHWSTFDTSATQSAINLLTRKTNVPMFKRR